METPNPHPSLLTDLLPQYRLINSIYEQVADSLKLSFESQCQRPNIPPTTEGKY